MLRDGHAIALSGMRGDRGVDFALVTRCPACDEREIFLSDLIVLELGGKVSLGGNVFGKQEDAACILVEAMNEAEAWVVGAGGREADLARKHVEDAVFLGASENGGKVGRFCHRYDVVVFVEDG